MKSTGTFYIASSGFKIPNWQRNRSYFCWNFTVDKVTYHTVFGARFENSPPCCQQTWQSVWFREHTGTQLRMQDDNERVNKMTLPPSKKEEKGIKWGKLNFRHFVVDFVRPVHWQHFLAAPGLFQVLCQFYVIMPTKPFEKKCRTYLLFSQSILVFLTLEGSWSNFYSV